jgi:hypothetical protein
LLFTTGNLCYSMGDEYFKGCGFIPSLDFTHQV